MWRWGHLRTTRRSDRASTSMSARRRPGSRSPTTCRRTTSSREVIIVGAGPTGLMLAGELGLAGVGPLVLERQPQPRDTPKAGGLSGQVLELLRYRGLLEWLEAAGGQARPAPRFPFGGMHADFTQLVDPPMQAVPLPQPQLERL